MSSVGAWRQVDGRWLWTCSYGECEGSGFITFTKLVFRGTPSARDEEFDRPCRCRPAMIAKQPGRGAAV